MRWKFYKKRVDKVFDTEYHFLGKHIIVAFKWLDLDENLEPIACYGLQIDRW